MTFSLNSAARPLRPMAVPATTKMHDGTGNADRFWVALGISQVDRILDFENGQDQLVFVNAAFLGFAAVRARAVDAQTDTSLVINLGNGDLLRRDGVSAAQPSADRIAFM
ncbi:MAG: hypothetical protein AAGD12_17320 [Pseudomonadota bacterium]